MTQLVFLPVWMALQIWWSLTVHWPVVKPKVLTLPPWILVVVAALVWMGSGWDLFGILVVLAAWYKLDMDVYLEPQTESDKNVTGIKFKNAGCILVILGINVGVAYSILATCVKINF
jgi:hypothetical protein